MSVEHMSLEEAQGFIKESPQANLGMIAVISNDEAGIAFVMVDANGAPLSHAIYTRRDDVEGIIKTLQNLLESCGAQIQ